MRYRSFAHTGIILEYIILYYIFLMFCILFTFVSKTPIFIVFATVVGITIPFSVKKAHPYAFTQFTFDKRGLSNKYISIQWEDIREIRVFRIVEEHKEPERRNQTFSFFRYDRNYKSIAAVGDIDAESYRELDPQKCVYFSMSQKNLRELERISNGRNTVISDFVYDHKKKIKKPS